MKRLFLTFTVVGICLITTGQVPKSFNYQTIIRKASGEVMAAKKVSLKFSILPDVTVDTVVYTERQSVITDKVGFISVTIGSGSDKIGNFTDIDWNANDYFLKVEIDTTGGTTYSELGPRQVLNEPVARHSKTSKKDTQDITEDKLFISRKYVGRFLDFRQTGPKNNNGPNLIWIKTSMDATFGKISAYGKKCEFSVGDNLYIRRAYYSPGGISGFWVYQIENDSSVYYRATAFQHDRKVFVDTWFK